jgi:hypothetical protein
MLEGGEPSKSLSLSLQGSNYSYSHDQRGSHSLCDRSEDDISIMTPSTVSSDDADLGFSSDDDDTLRECEVDFTRLSQPRPQQQKRHKQLEQQQQQQHQKQLGQQKHKQKHSVMNEKIFPPVQMNDATNQVLDVPACLNGLAGAFGDSTAEEEAEERMGDRNDGDCYVGATDRHEEEEEDEDDEEDEDNEDDESIGWAPTPVKSSSAEPFLSSRGARGGGHTFQSLANKFDSAARGITTVRSSKVNSSSSSRRRRRMIMHYSRHLRS